MSSIVKKDFQVLCLPQVKTLKAVCEIQNQVFEALSQEPWGRRFFKIQEEFLGVALGRLNNCTEAETQRIQVSLKDQFQHEKALVLYPKKLGMVEQMGSLTVLLHLTERGTPAVMGEGILGFRDKIEILSRQLGQRKNDEKKSVTIPLVRVRSPHARVVASIAEEARVTPERVEEWIKNQERFPRELYETAFVFSQVGLLEKTFSSLHGKHYFLTAAQDLRLTR